MDPVSILAGQLGTEFLKEGIKFLWAEAGKILDRYHKRQEKDAETVVGEAPAALKLPERRTVNFTVVSRSIDAMRDEMKSLALYANGVDPISLTDLELMTHADTLQRLIVEAYGIDAPELSATGRVRADVVEKGGRAIGVEAHAQSGTFDGGVDARTVKGTVIGTKIDTR
jgi:hypothetical protein